MTGLLFRVKCLSNVRILKAISLLSHKTIQNTMLLSQVDEVISAERKKIWHLHNHFSLVILGKLGFGLKLKSFLKNCAALNWIESRIFLSDTEAETDVLFICTFLHMDQDLSSQIKIYWAHSTHKANDKFTRNVGLGLCVLYLMLCYATLCPNPSSKKSFYYFSLLIYIINMLCSGSPCT